MRAPVLQEYVVAPPAVKTVEFPEQIVAVFAVTVGVLFTVIVAVFALVQLPLAPVTVYTVVTPGD